MQFPIWIIEVPHQMPATGWRCNNLSDLAEAAYSAGGDNWQWSDDPAEQDYLDALGHDLHGLTVCESLADLIGEAVGYGGHQDIRVRAQARELIASEIDFDAETVARVLDGERPVPYEDEYAAEDYDKCAQALAGHMAEYRAEKTKRDAARAALATRDAARRADYQATVDHWWNGLDASTRAEIEQAWAAADGERGKRRKRMREKARKLEKAHGRPEFTA